MKGKVRYDLLIPFAVVTFFSLLTMFGFYRMAENRMYDVVLGLKPAVPEDPRILILEVDDLAIAQVGTWPWSRSVIADGLLVLREFDADTVVFDIEYIDRSPLGVDSNVLTFEMPQVFHGEFDRLGEYTYALFDEVISGALSPEAAVEFVHELVSLSEQTRDYLLRRIGDIARDNDVYLGGAAAAFGNAFFTVNMLPDEIELIAVTEELRSFVLSEMGIDVVYAGGTVRSAPSIQPAILPIARAARGLGFPNVRIDEDGVRRRIELIVAHNDVSFAQLAFRPLLAFLGHPEVIVGDRYVHLSGAVDNPDATARDIRIPLNQDGTMLLNWPRSGFAESFRHLSFNPVYLHDRFYRDLVHNFQLMDEAGYLDFASDGESVISAIRYLDDIRTDAIESGDPTALTDVRDVREHILKEMATFLDGPTQSALLSYLDEVEVSLESEDDREYIATVRADVDAVFGAATRQLNELVAIRTVLDAELPGSFVFIGQTGISTTDIGVNPFEQEYMNVGTHATVVNTILSGQFLVELDRVFAIVGAVLLSMLVVLLVRRLSPTRSLLVGLVFTVLVFVASTAVFVLSGYYLPVLTIVLSVFTSFIAFTVMKFFLAENDKRFLRIAFSRYLSADVISQIIDDPSRLTLGGDKKQLTVIFTDVKGFSTISERLDPADLVRLLNEYLTEMSDIILDLQGTIDKYEGDAIISFFGAPVEFDDHAERACRAAIRMKTAEIILNEKFAKEGITPQPLHTRIGINTGEMVVGNMGTPKKMDYTVMGNAVNLAARLEGVNKRYGTWILTSEHTANRTNGAFVKRKLDRVRVVGIDEPVRLYEILAEHREATAGVREAIDSFHAGLEQFESRNWSKAGLLFRNVFKLLPGDNPSRVYVRRCEEFARQPPADDWDGVFNLTSK